MQTIIQNISTLTHFDSGGKFFSKKNCSVVIDKSGIVKEIKAGEIRKRPGAKIIDGKRLIGLPSFVDCHSHTLFAGSRANEFQMKCEGKSYLDIAAQGGGILATQQATKNASNQELIELVTERIRKFIDQGVRGLEIKTGYGLEHDEEIRHLQILQKIKSKHKHKIKIWITYLGPHAVLKSMDRESYLEEICLKTLPFIANESLADFVDIFVDDGFFIAHDMDRYCEAAKKHGLRIKAHIDEIKNLGGADIAIKHDLVSVDHCRHTTIDQFRRLKQNHIQSVLLPVTSFYIDEGFLDFNELRTSNIQPAISLDYNPGSQPALWWSFLLHIAMKKMKMTEMETLHATTIAPLKALNEKISDWSFGIGHSCKLNLFQANSISELAYRYGENLLQESFYTL